MAERFTHRDEPRVPHVERHLGLVAEAAIGEIGNATTAAAEPCALEACRQEGRAVVHRASGVGHGIDRDKAGQVLRCPLRQNVATGPDRGFHSGKPQGCHVFRQGGGFHPDEMFGEEAEVRRGRFPGRGRRLRSGGQVSGEADRPKRG